MHKISIVQTHQVLALLDSGTFGAKIPQELGLGFGTVSHIYSQHYSNLPKSSGGCPVKLSSANINYDRCIICMGKVDNAVQMAKTDRKSTRLNSSHERRSRMPSSA